MLKPFRHVANAATNPWFVIAGTVSSIASFIWLVYDKIQGRISLLPVVVFIFCSLFLLSGIFYSLKIRTENYALRRAAYFFNDINRIYRNSLKGTFGSPTPTLDSNKLVEEENRILTSVCQRIEKIFSLLIGRKCMVTIKLVTTPPDGGVSYACTYARSESQCERDNPIRNYQVGTGLNIGFDKALSIHGDSTPSHFYSGDLTKEKGYTNERPFFHKLYRSTIIVPIRAPASNQPVRDINDFDLIGFLCLDTNSVNRLNDHYHVEILCSLASQMYNYMSLMRGSYITT